MKMCGIAGFSLNPLDTVNAKRLSKAMLLDIESRGRDATGFAFLDSTGKLQIHKRPLAASKFIQGRLCMPKRSRTIIMHTRFATQGAPENNDNNHPVWQANIAGVHNGWVHNDDAIFAKIKEVAGGDVRIAEVDSEAIFAALGWLDVPVTDVLESLSGNASVAWLDQNDEIPNRLHLARVDSSPLVLLTTKNGSMLFASTESAVRAGAKAVGLEIATVTHVAEGQYMQVVDGELLKVEKFEVPKRYSYSGSYAKYSGGTTNYGASRTFDNRTNRYNEWDDGVYDLHDYMDKARERREAAQATIDAGKRAQSAGSETLAEKVLREVQDDIDLDDAELPDEDDEHYQQWLADNAREIDHILDKEELADGKFTEYLRCPRVNTYMISHADYFVPVPTDSEYLAVPGNENREWDIERWMVGIHAADEATKTNAARAMKADVRPGRTVRTSFDGRSYDGHVVEVPRTFPDGDYILRLFADAPEGWKKAFNTDSFLVARRYWQFETLDSKSTDLVLWTPEASK